LNTLKNRNIIILAALILGGVVALEIYTDITNPYIDYEPGTFTPSNLGATQVFSYYKDGVLIGNYSYRLDSMKTGSNTIFTLNSTVNVVYQGSQLNVDTSYRFRDAVTPLGYSVNFDLSGNQSNLRCTFQQGSVDISSSSQGKNQTVGIDTQTNTVLIDNNNPAHWELFDKSFNPEPGKKYNVNVLVPQQAGITAMQFGVGTNTQDIKIGSKTYNCTVASEPDLSVTLYFYQGNLIEYKNDQDGLIIVKNIT
jgi:hypothetical protein